MRVRLMLLLAFGLVVSTALPAVGQQGTAIATILHGLTGAPVDVYLNGQLALDDFQAGMITDPLSQPSGNYTVEVRAADAPPDGPVIASGSYVAAPDSNGSVIAALDAEGTAGVSRYANNVTGLGAGQGRLTVRHSAAAPTMDILTGGTPVLTGVSSASELSVDLPANSFEIAVALAGTAEPVLPPAQVEVAAGSQTVVYPVGSAEDGTLELLVQTISGNPVPPGQVAAGDGGAAAPAGMPSWVLSGLVLAALAAVGSALRLRGARR